MFSLFQNRHPLAILFLVPLAAVFSFLVFWFSSGEIHALDFTLLQKSFELPMRELAYLYFAVLTVNAMLLSTLFNRLNLIDFFSYIPGLFYLIFSFACVSLNQINMLFAELFLILGVLFITQIKNNVDAKASVFNAAWFIAIGVVLLPSFALLLLLPFIALARTRSFVFREYLLVLLAYVGVASYLFFFYFYYGLGFSLPWHFKTNFVFPGYEYAGVLSSVFLIMILGAFTRSRTLGSPGIRIARIVTLLFSAAVLQFLAFVVFFLLKTESFLNVSVFLSLYVGYTYHFTQVKFVYHFLGYSILVLALLQHFEMF